MVRAFVCVNVSAVGVVAEIFLSVGENPVNDAVRYITLNVLLTAPLYILANDNLPGLLLGQNKVLLLGRLREEKKCLHGLKMRARCFSRC